MMRLALRLGVHGALLVLPLVVLGRGAYLVRIAALACVTSMLAFAEVEHLARRGADPSRFGAPGTYLALVSALGLLATTWAACGLPAPHAHSWLGLVLVMCGVLLRAVAIRTLGASFTSETVLTPGRPLVKAGIYSWLRHPSEVGLLLVAFGLAVLGGSLVALAMASLVVAPSVALRIAQEERLLAGAAPHSSRSVPNASGT